MKERLNRALHLAWQVSIVIVILAGMLHLLNLTSAGRFDTGVVLVTPFRASFFISWLLLAADLVVSRRRLTIDLADALVAVLVLVFTLRGIFVTETFGIALNWIFTGAGVFYLVKHGARDRKDACLVLYAVLAAIAVICLFGLVEYYFRANPLFDDVQVKVVGSDDRIGASDQFYRVRSLVGHPGYVAALLLAAMPLVAYLLRRRRIMLFAAMAVIPVVILLTYSRGSWILAALIFVPVLLYMGRSWLRRNIKWILPLAALAIALLVFDYINKAEVTASLSGEMSGDGLSLVEAGDGLYAREDDEGVRPGGGYLYFDIDDDFYQEDASPVTVVINFFDRGYGGVWVEYSPQVTAGSATVYYSQTNPVFKHDTQQWTSAAFYIEAPGYDSEVAAPEFRIVDGESSITVSRVTLNKGKLSLPDLVVHQWLARRGSFSTRMEFFPFTWRMLKDNPLGVGLFNTPGTDHHAIDSLPLTWMIEFGWLGLLLIAGMIWLVISEGINVCRNTLGLASMLYFALVLLILHGAHLMILYDKPSLVMTAVLSAIYADIRPWRRGGPAVDISNSKCML